VEGGGGREGWEGGGEVWATGTPLLHGHQLNRSLHEQASALPLPSLFVVQLSLHKLKRKTTKVPSTHYNCPYQGQSQLFYIGTGIVMMDTQCISVNKLGGSGGMPPGKIF